MLSHGAKSELILRLIWKKKSHICQKRSPVIQKLTDQQSLDNVKIYSPLIHLQLNIDNSTSLPLDDVVYTTHDVTRPCGRDVTSAWFHFCSTLTPEMSNFASKLGQISPKWDKSVYSGPMESPWVVPFGAKSDLICVQLYIPDYHCTVAVDSVTSCSVIYG